MQPSLLPDESEDLSAPDVVDDEDTGRESSAFKPWDPSKIRITTKHFSLRDVVDQIVDQEIDLSPDFQRDYVWKARQRTRLVESILLGIPLPAFYFNQDYEGKYQVVDGVQRLSTISLFMGDGHILDRTDLEYLTDLDGLKYSQLDLAASRRFRSTQIVVHVIEPQTPDEVKYDIFGRVNTLGSPLSAQEIRHAMSKERSRDFLKELAEMPAFDEATGWHYWRRDSDAPDGKSRDSGRMTNRELALRFCAFRHYTDEEYRQHSSLDAFLVEYTHRLDGSSESGVVIPDQNLNALRDDFARAMQNAYRILGKAAFRRWPPSQSRRGPINRAVFESQAIALADYALETLLPKKDVILDEFRKTFDDQEYARAVTVGTGDPKAVERRLAWTKEILAEILA
ncbi:GmrSD restriction endonuclease domain-containing protein [Ralstonia pseudosolanacearum]